MTGATFGMVPFAILTNANLGHAAVRLYGILTAYANRARAFEAWPSQRTLARDMGAKDVRSVRYALDQLEAAGCIERTRLLVNGMRAGCVYRLLAQVGKTQENQTGNETSPRGDENLPLRPEADIPVEHTIREQTEDSGADAPGAVAPPAAPPSARKALWDEIKNRIGGRNPGALVGKWIKLYGIGTLCEAHFAALTAEPADYVQWMTARLQILVGQRPRPGWRQASTHGPETSCIDKIWEPIGPDGDGLILEGEAMPWNAN